MKISRLVPRYQGSPIAVAACFATVLGSACGSSTTSGQPALDAHGAGGVTSGGTGGTTSLGTGGQGSGGTTSSGGATSGASGKSGTGGTTNGAGGGQGTGGSIASGGIHGTGGVTEAGGTRGSGGVTGSGGGKGTGGTTGLDAGADAASGCPAQLPLSGGACSGPLTCTYGQATCCGITSSAWTCTCQGGSFSCSQTTECNFICPGGDGGTIDAALDAGRQDATSVVDASGVGAACGGAGDPACSTDTYCEWSDNLCGARTHGACATIPRGVACVIPAAPVCGCDGKNYPGTCDAAKAGVDISSSTSCPEPAGMFRCGWSYCQHNVDYCYAQVGGAVSNPGSYVCDPLPAACNGVPGCACVTGGSTCNANAQGDVTVTLAVP